MAGIHYALDIPLAIETNHAGRDNPKGFFENSDVVQFNDRILSGCGASWEHIGACLTLDRESPEYQTYRREAMTLLNARFGGCPVWGMKDPRFSVLLPFWEDVLGDLGAQVYRVIALRHPLEVALSQQTRHHAFPDFHLAGKDVDYTLNLWYWYNDRLLRDLQDDRNWIVGFDDLLAAPDTVLGRIGQILDRPVLSDRLAEYGKQFLEKELKRHHVNPAAMAMFQGRYGYVFTLYERLKAYACGKQMVLSDVPGVLKDLPDAQLLRSWVIPMYGYVDTLKSRLQEKREELAAAGLQAEQIRQQHDAVQARIQSLEQNNVQKEHRNAELEAQIQDQAKALAESQGIIAGMEQTIADCRRELSQVSISRDELRVQLTATEQELTEAKQQIESGTLRIHSLEAEITQKEKAAVELKAAIDKTTQDLVAAQSTLQWQQKNTLRLKAELDDTHKALAEARKQIAHKDKAAAELEAALQSKTISLEEALGRIELAERDIEQYRDQVGRLNAIRDDIQAQADGLGRQLHDVLQEKEQAMSRIQGLGDELGQKEKAVAGLSAEIESKTKLLDDTRHEMEQKLQEIARYRSELYDVYTSGSWRHTVWFRKIRRVFK